MKKRSGFTLLELLVVLVLMAITAAAAVPAFTSASRRAPERELATTIASLLTTTRDAARESGRSATLVFSPHDGRYWITRGDSTTTDVLALGALRLAGDNDRIECRFTAAGPATRCVISVQGATSAAVRVDEWSGEVRIDDAR